MTARTSRRLAWFVWVVSMLLAATTVAVLIAGGFAHPPDAFAFPGFSLFVGVVQATVGLLVASRRPANAIGWLLLTLAVIGLVQDLTTGYAAMALARPSPGLPAVAYAAWTAEWIDVPVVGGTLVFLFLLFPHGRLPGRTGAVVAVIGGTGVVLGAAGSALRPGPLGLFPTIDNPVALLGNSAVAEMLADGVVLVALAGLVAVVGMLRRWRRASGAERLQYKWLVTAGWFVAVPLGIAVILSVVAPRHADRWWSPIEVLLMLGFAAIPVAVGIAILRYRLYDIDRVISRTVTYALVVGVLIGVYGGSVLLLGWLLPLQSDVAVAASTLAVAALFNPLRRRVQRLVDRRFNRARYDIARIVDAFGMKLRDELDIDEVTDDLVAVVATTVQPDMVSIWLADADA